MKLNTVVDKERNYGIDSLRIIAMVMVVTHHFLSHGGVLNTAIPLTFNWYIVWFVRAVCYTSVTMFFLISAYFQSKRSIGLQGIIRIWAEVWFYSVFCFLISCFVGWTTFSWLGLAKALFPVVYRQYGFFNGYLLLAFLSPFLNKAVEAFSKKMHFCLIGLLTVLCCVIPYLSFVDAFNLSYGEGPLWLLLLYITAAYIQKYSKDTRVRLPLVIGLGLCFMQFLSKVLIAIITKLLLGEVKYSGAFIGETPLLSFLASVMIFIAFKNQGPKMRNATYKKIIGSVAPLVYSVFLVHENNNLKYQLWNFINPSRYANAALWKLSLLWIIVIFVFFTVPMIIEKIRLFIENKLSISFKITMTIKESRLFNWCNRKLEEMNGINEQTK